MTLSGYVDSLVETYYDCGEAPELMEYVERWEKRQPKADDRVTQKEVKSRRQLREATASAAKECLEEEFPELFSYTDVQGERENRANAELAAMAKQSQQPHTRHVSQQLHAYKCWRGAFIRNGTVPDCGTLSQFAYDRLEVQFPNAHGPTEWAMLFGFADQLPADQQDSERIKALQYRGFHYPSECKYVQRDHDKLLREVAEKAAAREAEAEQIRLQREAERQQERARWVQQAKINQGYQEAQAARQRRADELRSQAKSQATNEPRTHTSTAQEPPLHDYAPPQRDKTRTAYRNTKTTQGGFFALIGKLAKAFVSELIDESFPGEKSR